MLKKSLRVVDRVSEEIIEHPIRNAKIAAGTIIACLALEKLHEGYNTWRDRSAEEPTLREEMPAQPQPLEDYHE